MASTRSAATPNTPQAPQEQTAKPELKTIVGIGSTVTLKSLGDVEVRELSLEATIRLSDSLIEILQVVTTARLPGDDSEGANVAWLVTLVKNPKTLEAMYKIAAAATNREEADFHGMPISDWLKFLVAFKSEVDWEELKSIFFQLVPREKIKNLRGAIT